MNELELQTAPESGFVRMFNPSIGDDSVTDVPEEAFEGFWSEKGWQLYGGNAESVPEAPVEAQAPAEAAPKKSKDKE